VGVRNTRKKRNMKYSGITKETNKKLRINIETE
jgi:hypothetical protein